MRITPDELIEFKKECDLNSNRIINNLKIDVESEKAQKVVLNKSRTRLIFEKEKSRLLIVDLINVKNFKDFKAVMKKHNEFIDKQANSVVISRAKDTKRKYSFGAGAEMLPGIK